MGTTGYGNVWHVGKEEGEGAEEKPALTRMGVRLTTIFGFSLPISYSVLRVL